MTHNESLTFANSRTADLNSTQTGEVGGNGKDVKCV